MSKIETGPMESDESKAEIEEFYVPDRFVKVVVKFDDEKKANEWLLKANEWEAADQAANAHGGYQLYSVNMHGLEIVFNALDETGARTPNDAVNLIEGLKEIQKEGGVQIEFDEGDKK